MRKRNPGLFLASFGLALATACAPGFAQMGGMMGPRGGGRRGNAVMGTITSVGVRQFEIKKQDGTQETILLNDKTRLMEARQAIQLEDLKTGDHVLVRGRLNNQKQYEAVMVRRVTEQEMQRFQNMGDRAFGQITSIKGNEIKVNSPMAGEQTIVVTDKTTFVKDGQTAALKDLKLGDRIFAMGKLENGHLNADRVMSGRMMMRRGGGMMGGQRPPSGQ